VSLAECRRYRRQAQCWLAVSAFFILFDVAWLASGTDVWWLFATSLVICIWSASRWMRAVRAWASVEALWETLESLQERID